MKMRFKWTVVVAVLILTLTSAAAVLAAPPASVHIEVSETMGIPSPDPFTATGALCPEGTVYDVSSTSSGPPGGTFRIIRADKHFECADGSGTFDVTMVVYLDLVTHQTTATWRITGGTGDYADLHGNGTLVGTPIVPGASIYDVYDGYVH